MSALRSRLNLSLRACSSALSKLLTEKSACCLCCRCGWGCRLSTALPAIFGTCVPWDGTTWLLLLPAECNVELLGAEDVGRPDREAAWRPVDSESRADPAFDLPAPTGLSRRALPGKLWAEPGDLDEAKRSKQHNRH